MSGMYERHTVSCFQRVPNVSALRFGIEEFKALASVTYPSSRSFSKSFTGRRHQGVLRQMVGTKPLGTREESFPVDVYSGDKLIAQGVESELIYNGMKYSEPMFYYLYPSSKEDYDEIRKHFELSARGFFGGTEIHISKAYRQSATTWYGTSPPKLIVDVSPAEIYRTRCWENQEDKSKIYFFLTDNGIFRTAVETPWHPLSAQVSPEVILDIGDGWSATFKRHYSHIDAEIDDTKGRFSTGYLVLELEKDNYRLSSIDEVQEKSDLVTQLCWYLSFASRQMTLWQGWSALMEDGDVTYRRAMSVPEEISQYQYPLIEHKLVQQFLQHSIEYIHDRSNLDLRLPIMYVVNSYKPENTMEYRFLSAYTSLEALLNLYAENQGASKYIDGQLETEFFSSLKELVENLPGTSSKAKDAMISKMRELNRVSPRTRYKDFCREKHVSNSDLWPVYESSKHPCKYPSLYKIRNGLTHGRHLESVPLLDMAIDHLQWTVERCLLAELEWESANARPDFLREYYPSYSEYSTALLDEV
jgi:hypothetical protein